VTVPEDPGEEGTKQKVRSRDARLVTDAVCQHTGGIEGLDRPLVLPAALREHLRSLQEAPALLEADESDVVIVDRKHSKEEDPRAA
jgi:hypothetical protein